MKLALPMWNGRVSPVFDSAQRALVVQVEADKAIDRTEQALGTIAPGEKVSRLASLGVNVLVCGAISRPMAAMVEAAGIELIPWVAGKAEEVLEAYLQGRLMQDCFCMPGYRRRRLRAGCHRGRRGRGGKGARQ